MAARWKTASVAGRDDAAEVGGIAQIHFHAGYARIVAGGGRLDDIHQGEVDILPLGQQGLGKPLAEKAGAASDDDIFHGVASVV